MFLAFHLGAQWTKIIAAFQPKEKVNLRNSQYPDSLIIHATVAVSLIKIKMALLLDKN